MARKWTDGRYGSTVRKKNSDPPEAGLVVAAPDLEHPAERRADRVGVGLAVARAGLVADGSSATIGEAVVTAVAPRARGGVVDAVVVVAVAVAVKVGRARPPEGAISTSGVERHVLRPLW